MKEFWHNFFYGFGIAAILIVCMIFGALTIARLNEKVQVMEQKAGAVISTPAF